MLTIIFNFIIFFSIFFNGNSLDIFIRKYCIKKSKVYDQDLISVLGTINTLDTIDITSEESGYYRIKWKKRDGYVLKENFDDCLFEKDIGLLILSKESDAFANEEMNIYLGKIKEKSRYLVKKIIHKDKHKIFKTKNCYFKLKDGEYILKEIK